MSSDKLIFDLSNEIEGSPNVFIRKDWINIIDNQNQSYVANTSVIDTSQLSNSNKWMSYKEAYLLCPMIMTLSTTTGVFEPATAATSADYALGLKNWFGSIIHSMTLDYQGVTIIQQTPWINMWNTFKLLTSLSWQDVHSIGSTIGFYPDCPTSWGFDITGTTLYGPGTSNNSTYGGTGPTNLPADYDIKFNSYDSLAGNIGFVKRMQYINFDPEALTATATDTYQKLIDKTQLNTLYKSYIFNKINQSVGGVGLIEYSITATIYLRHLHSFFQMCPLLRGAFMKITLFLNNSSVNFTVTGTAVAVPVTTNLQLTSVNVPVGGVCPLMIASVDSVLNQGGSNVKAVATTGAAATYTATLSVGSRCLVSSVKNLTGYSDAPSASSIYLYIPSYDFNPTFEDIYVSSPIKSIKYTDVYQFPVNGVGAGSPFNSLLTNGISGAVSVLIIPFYSVGTVNIDGTTVSNNGLTVPVYQSPFDPAGCGATSPLCLFTGFNVVVSGQNAIYNNVVRSFEEFNNQLYGVNSVNGGLTDGLSSGLIDSLGFEMEQCYYYVNVERMLPVEESVPKSIRITGINQSRRNLDLFCFVEYKCNMDVDLNTGARV